MYHWLCWAIITPSPCYKSSSIDDANWLSIFQLNQKISRDVPILSTNQSSHTNIINKSVKTYQYCQQINQDIPILSTNQSRRTNIVNKSIKTYHYYQQISQDVPTLSTNQSRITYYWHQISQDLPTLLTNFSIIAKSLICKKDHEIIPKNLLQCKPTTTTYRTFYEVLEWANDVNKSNIDLSN